MKLFSTVKRPLASAALLGLACLAATPAGAADGKGMAYVTNQNGDITVIDLATLETVSEIDVGAEGPRGLGVTADGTLLVTANGEAGNLSVIDRATGKVLRHIAIGKNPEFVRVRGDYAFVSFEPAAVGGPPPKPGSAEAKTLEEEREKENAEPAKIAVVDLKQGKVIRTITGGMETEGIEFSADGKMILVTNEADENISVHEIATGKLVKKISTKKYGNRPRGIKMAPDGKSYAATLEYGNKLVLLDADFNVVKALSTGEVPYGLAFDRKRRAAVCGPVQGQGPAGVRHQDLRTDQERADRRSLLALHFHAGRQSDPGRLRSLARNSGDRRRYAGAGQAHRRQEDAVGHRDVSEVGGQPRPTVRGKPPRDGA